MSSLARVGLVLMFSTVAANAAAQTIKKCQDADGNWHYGDYAAAECERSKVVTEMDRRGLRVKEHGPPPTAAELEAKRLAEQRDKERAESAAEQRKLDERLLSTYDSVAGIESARDARVAALDRAIKVDQTFKADLQRELDVLKKGSAKGKEDNQRMVSLQAQINEYDQAIAQKRRHRDDLVARYNNDLQRFRDLTERSASAGTR